MSVRRWVSPPDMPYWWFLTSQFVIGVSVGVLLWVWLR